MNSAVIWSIVGGVVALGTGIGCGIAFNPSPFKTNAVISYKNHGQEGDYSESIEEFEIGKTFYTCIKVDFQHHSVLPIKYDVIITVPKTKDVIVDNRGGLGAYDVIEDLDVGVTTLKYTVEATKNQDSKKMLFAGTPYSEGKARISVDFHRNDNGELIANHSYSSTIFFKYDVGK